MPSVLEFDEINRPERNPSYEEYFDAVPYLSRKQKADRVRLAQRIGDSVKNAFNLMLAMIAYGNADWQDMKEHLAELMLLAIAGMMNVGEDVEFHIRDMASEIMDVTENRIDDEYYTSEDRARGIGENISEQVWNDADFKQAVEQHKTRKQWESMKDSRVRDTHADADGQVRPITDPFLVGESLLMYPGDWSLGADANEIINCRCGVRYF